jgi:membrane AbrB-like protein
MATVPAGMSDTPIIAAEIGADAGKVTILQFIRLISGIAIFPSMISAYDRQVSRFSVPEECETSSEPGKCLNSRIPRRLIVFITLATAIVGGWFGLIIGMPAGALTMSMIAVIVLKLTTGFGSFPPFARRVTQLLSGAYIGCGMNGKDLAELRFLVIPMIIILIGYTVNCFVVGTFLHRVFKMERKVAMLAVTPAGARDMALISADIGVFSTDLVVIQILRMILVISIFPQIILLIVRFAG